MGLIWRERARGFRSDAGEERREETTGMREDGLSAPLVLPLLIYFGDSLACLQF